jgi:hypothetical protein
MGIPPARYSIFGRAKGLLALALGLLILGGAPRVARGQRIALEVDQKALTKLFRGQIGTSWVLLKWGGTSRLVLEKPRLSITPLGIYVAGTLKSTSPSFSTAVEVRVRPRVRGGRVEIVPADVLVVRPSGVWGMIPRQILTRWLKSASGVTWLSQAGLDLSPLLVMLGKPKKVTVKLRLGFGRLTLSVQL